jgi:hypothetical protein
VVILPAITSPQGGTMVRTKSIVSLLDVKGQLEQDLDFLKELLREVIEETLEQQMDETLGAQEGPFSAVLSCHPRTTCYG